ncbi:hypothetical protein Uis1B_0551 [Bifidobacterium margollesii]|uniref:tRNA nuclease CdiA C-terminal domain-containing protein n=1 Tax=Bifidobacterium margollesii TaxID=2020964 RepID=A0A2N5JBG8_9BIFI|nr:hypothetical protein [Bifidobacterium margollesii]PLS31560.1 hypothetical protein Uis1B_0551 [Bifidobacterium margollesii]
MADDNSRTPGRGDVDDLAKAQASAVRAARRELKRTFETVYNMYDDPADIRNALLDLVPAIAAKYGNAGSVAAAEWYEQVRAKWFKEQTDIDTTYQPDDKAIKETVRRLAGHLWDKDDGTPADPDAMLKGMLANMDRWVKAGGRETIAKATRRDPGKPRFARVPQGKTCGFCIMLASRGFVYSSAEAAGGDMNDYHNDCDCEPIPSWDKKNPKIEGYDPDKLYERYTACRSTIESLLTEERYRKTYVDPFVPQYEDDKPKDFDWWVARQIAAEMDCRDRQWLLDGKRVPVSYASLRAKKELKLHEKKTVEYLAEHGFRQWIAERSNKPGQKTADAVINRQTVDYKSPEGNSYNGIDGLIRHAGEQHAVGAVIHLQKGRSIISTEDCDSHIIQSLSHRKKLSWVLRIDYDGNMRRFVNE